MTSLPLAMNSSDDAHAPLLIGSASSSRTSILHTEHLELVSSTSGSQESSDVSLNGDSEDLDLDGTASSSRIPYSEAPGLGALHWDEARTSGRSHRPSDIERRDRRRRRIYGGNVAGSDDELDDYDDADIEGNEGHGLSVPQVAWQVSATLLGPINPVLVPHAFSLLGWKSGVISVLVIATMVWLSYIIVIVEARYVGARTFPQIARAVFPLRGNSIATLIVGLWTIWVQGGKTIIGIVVLSSLIRDLASVWFSQNALFANPTFITIAVSIFYLCTTVLFPRRPRSASLVRLTSFANYSIIFWPLALMLTALRIPHIDWDSFAPGHSGRNRGGELLGFSPWGGIAILFFAFSPHAHLFQTYSSLRTTTRRHSWEVASFIGILPAMLIILSWGVALRGLLAYRLPPSEVDGSEDESATIIGINVFDDLPLEDGWIQLARMMVAFTGFVNLPTIMAPARNSVYDAFRTAEQCIRRWHAERHYNINSEDRERLIGGDDGDNGDNDEHRRIVVTEMREQQRRKHKLKRIIKEKTTWKWGFGKRVSGGVAWGVACFVALWLRSNIKAARTKNNRLASVVEILGCTGSVILGYLFPAMFFIVLFHIRKPRHIFVSDPTRPEIQSDTLLLRKERESQRRVTGKRVWQDLCVCVVLLPMSVAVLLRGLLAMGRKTNW